MLGPERPKQGAYMQTVQVPREAWSRTLDDFSAVHDGWLVSVDVLSAEMGAQPEVQGLPLIGVVAEPGGDGGAITISAARPAAGQITHTIHSPTRLWIERSDEGADAAVQIESADGAKTIVRFRTSALPETVDGMPPAQGNRRKRGLTGGGTPTIRHAI